MKLRRFKQVSASLNVYIKRFHSLTIHSNRLFTVTSLSRSKYTAFTIYRVPVNITGVLTHGIRWITFCLQVNADQSEYAKLKDRAPVVILWKYMKL